MDYCRIAGAVDTDKLRNSSIGLVGAGASACLATNLARCGVGSFKLIDSDVVSRENIARQQHDATDIGRPKVEALGDALRRVNPDVLVASFCDDFLALSDDQLDCYFGGCNLLIFATDKFRVQARGNQFVLRRSIPGLWIGMYEGGGAAEIIMWHKELDACYRCLCASRYAAHAAPAGSASLDPPSDGCTILDVSLVDSIAGMLALGLLTRDSNNRFGRLIDQLGDRNFIQVQLDPEWTISGSNPVRTYLGVAQDNRSFFSWNTIVRADPDGGRLPCLDCTRFRGHEFRQQSDGTFVRVKPTNCAFTGGLGEGP